MFLRKTVAAHDFPQAAAGGFKNFRQVAQHAVGLGGDVPGE